MTTIETVLHSYRYLLTHKHPEELKQLACVDAALQEIATTPTPDAVKLAGELAATYLREHFREDVRLFLLEMRNTAPSWNEAEALTNELLLSFTTAHAATVARLERERDEGREIADSYRDNSIAALGTDYNPQGKGGSCVAIVAESITRLRADLSAARAELKQKDATLRRAAAQMAENADLRAQLTAAIKERDDQTSMVRKCWQALGSHDDCGGAPWEAIARLRAAKKEGS